MISRKKLLNGGKGHMMTSKYVLTSELSLFFDTPDPNNAEY